MVATRPGTTEHSALTLSLPQSVPKDVAFNVAADVESFTLSCLDITLTAAHSCTATTASHLIAHRVARLVLENCLVATSDDESMADGMQCLVLYMEGSELSTWETTFPDTLTCASIYLAKKSYTAQQMKLSISTPHSLICIPAVSTSSSSSLSSSSSYTSSSSTSSSLSHSNAATSITLVNSIHSQLTVSSS